MASIFIQFYYFFVILHPDFPKPTHKGSRQIIHKSIKLQCHLNRRRELMLESLLGAALILLLRALALVLVVRRR
jgi:hypothetical protein